MNSPKTWEERVAEYLAWKPILWEHLKKFCSVDEGKSIVEPLVSAEKNDSKENGV